MLLIWTSTVKSNDHKVYGVFCKHEVHSSRVVFVLYSVIVVNGGGRHLRLGGGTVCKCA